jgi:hypothetical protein
LQESREERYRRKETDGKKQIERDRGKKQRGRDQ